MMSFSNKAIDLLVNNFRLMLVKNSSGWTQCGTEIKENHAIQNPYIIKLLQRFNTEDAKRSKIYNQDNTCRNLRDRREDQDQYHIS